MGPRRRLGNWLIGIFVLLALPVLLLWTFQRKLIYLPFPGPGSPRAAGLNSAETVTIRTEDGLELGGWFVPPPAGGSGTAVLVCSGNGGNRAFRGRLGEALAQRGLGVLLFDYRGYGDNPGSPTEAGLAADARAARAWLAAREEIDASRIIYFGESLGAAVAIGLAVEHPPAALILRSPFTSLADAAQVHYPFLPVGIMLWDRYPSLQRIPSLRSPLLVIAGDADGIVPLENSRKLYEAAVSPKRLVVVPGADHNDAELLDGEILLQAVEELLTEHDLR